MIWKSVSRSGKGPKAACDLCGRVRGMPSGPGFDDPEDAVFRRVCVDGAAESVTVCGSCFRARAPRAFFDRSPGRVRRSAA